MSYTLRTSFENLGLSHVLSISGLHVVILLAVVAWICEKLRVPPTLQKALEAFLLGFYLLMTGFVPPLVRAVWMGVLKWGAQASRRRYDGFSALAAAFLAQTLWNPLTLLRVGFQLSYLATAGLLLLGRVPAWMERRTWGKFALPAAQTTAAFAVTWPFIAYAFGQVSLWSVLTNLIFVPLIPFVLGAILVWTVTLPFAPEGFLPLRIAVQWSGSSYLEGIRLLGQHMHAFPLIANRLWACLPYEAGICLLAPVLRRVRWWMRAAGLILCAAAAAILLWPQVPAEGIMVMGDGLNCMFLCRSDGASVLLAGTPVRGMYDLLRRAGVTELDVLLFTADEDALDSTLFRLQDMPIGKVITTGAEDSDADCQILTPDASYEEMGLLAEIASVYPDHSGTVRVKSEAGTLHFGAASAIREDFSDWTAGYWEPADGGEGLWIYSRASIPDGVWNNAYNTAKTGALLVSGLP